MFNLTLRDLFWSAKCGRTDEGNNVRPMLEEKSDDSIVAMKPVKAGGAKGVME